jgi:hypothetical protein
VQYDCFHCIPPGSRGEAFFSHPEWTLSATKRKSKDEKMLRPYTTIVGAIPNLPFPAF